MSGASVAFPLALKYNLKPLCIRKKEDLSHYICGQIITNINYKPDFSDVKFVEGDVSAQQYIIVDDFIASGKTVNNIIECMSKETKAVCVGMIMYAYYADLCHYNNIPIYGAAWEAKQKEMTLNQADRIRLLPEDLTPV